MTQKYDIIGDIHGHAEPLRALLGKLGYRELNGVHAHPERKVLFLGDYVDRGPAIREVLQIVRGMTDAGNARAIMGNHEFNALAYHTEDGKGGHLRERSSKNKKQHQATMEQIAIPYPDEWTGWLDWFRTLPLALDLAGLRAVHAGWSDSAVGLVKDLGPLSPDKLAMLADKQSPLGRAKEILLNGLELNLPKGHTYFDKEGYGRETIRTRWWLDFRGKTYREAIFPDSELAPLLPIPPEQVPSGHQSYATDAPPVFNGHYWLPPHEAPALQAENIAILDYSVARDGMLVAYRWDGEQKLDRAKFVTVENRPAAAVAWENGQRRPEIKFTMTTMTAITSSR